MSFHNSLIYEYTHVTLQAMARSYSFFGALSHLAVKVDDETHELKERMTGEPCKSKPEDAALLLLELQNEMKTLYVSESTLTFLSGRG